MTASPILQQPAIDSRLSGQALLYQFSNTMFSTIRLNKLTHLILTALTAPSSKLFERSILFLCNDKSEVLQGMLGVTRQTSSEGLLIIGDQNALGSRWDISEELVAKQRSDEFSALVRRSRIEINSGCPLVRQVVTERTLSHIECSICNNCKTCCFIRQICCNSFAAVPLTARDKTIGMIVVDNPESGRPITQDELYFLQLLANQAGMAIENSILYNKVEDANTNLREARERLLHGEKLAAIGEMAANLAHELKNPLITIGGFAGRLLKSLPEETREHHYADTIAAEVKRLDRMIADILGFSRKPTICFSKCDLTEVVQSSIACCTTALEDSGVTLTTSIADGPWLLHGDAYQLKQVFLNLILNACDAMSGGGQLSISIRKSSPKDNSAIVEIKDTGKGIPKDVLPRIFSPFFTTKQHGTGLGLAIANRIAINHYGSIEAENCEDGASFKVRLPLAALD
ncbi:MAG: GAF domain-containing protein [Geobacter sp.]|nr:GAF domain-containing protein [Geobacter sp.]